MHNLCKFMWKILKNIKIKDFDKFLKFAKQKEEPEKFKVVLKGGINIFHGGRKIAMIYRVNSNTKNFSGGDVVLNTDIFDKKRDILQSERIEVGTKIWNDLMEQYENSK